MFWENNKRKKNYLNRITSLENEISELKKMRRTVDLMHQKLCSHPPTIIRHRYVEHSHYYCENCGKRWFYEESDRSKFEKKLNQLKAEYYKKLAEKSLEDEDDDIFDDEDFNPFI